MRLIYAFPEPLPLGRARGLQVVSTIAALARAGLQIELAFVPAGNQDPFGYYGLVTPDTVRLTPVSRSLPWPLARIHSNRMFFINLRRMLGGRLGQQAVMVRHLKLARMLIRSIPGACVLYEAHEVFADTVAAGRRSGMLALEREVVLGAGAVVANSGPTAKRLTELYGRSSGVSVISNGVERPAGLPVKPWHEAGRHIVYAGSFFPWKGAAELVQAAGKLPGLCISMIGGDDAGISRLRGLSNLRGARLDFPGRLAHAEVMKRLEQACIAVLPNRDDADSAFTSPIKLFEYMSTGCAIVASDLPAIREILDEDEAIWCRPGDPASLAEGIRRLAENPEQARSLGARVREKSIHYTWDARATRLKAVLESLRAPGQNI